MPQLQIRDFMTTSPQCIQSIAPVIDGHRRMQRAGFHHLPVLDGDQPIGIVSEGGLDRLEAEMHVDGQHDSVLDVMEVPYFVSPDAPLAEVSETMARRRHDATMVVEQGRLVGIFTAVDALHALGRVPR